MKRIRLASLLILSMLSLNLAALSVQAQSDFRNSAIAKTKEKQVNTPQFSLRAPNPWIIDQSQSRLTLYNQQPPKQGSGTAPPFLIKTEAFLASAPLAELVASNEPIDGKLIRKQTLNLAGREAIRKWYERGENFEKTIQTFIRYSDRKTIAIISYYGSQNRAAEPAIYSIHNSIKLRQ